VDLLIYLIPISLAMGMIGLAAFLWAQQSGQFEDPEGAAERILHSDDEPLAHTPLQERQRAE
jgi:cbb3-type cytochrome oxidase maturation protein